MYNQFEVDNEVLIMGVMLIILLKINLFYWTPHLIKQIK